MENKHDDSLWEQIECFAFSVIMGEYSKEEGDRLLQEYEELEKNGELVEMPPELDRKCRKLIAKTLRKQQIEYWTKWAAKSLARVATLALVLVGVTSLTVLSVDSFRIPVLNFLMDESGKYSTLAFDSTFDNDASTDNRIMSQFELYLPEGYSVVHRTFDSSSGTIYATNINTDVVYLEFETTTRGINIDTEKTTYTEIDFGDGIAVFSSNDGYRLRWLDSNDDIVYTLYASAIDINSFWKFAYAIIE